MGNKRGKKRGNKNKDRKECGLHSETRMGTIYRSP